MCFIICQLTAKIQKILEMPGIELIRCLTVSAHICSQARNRASFISCTVSIFMYLSLFFIRFHTISMEFRSGLFAGQPIASKSPPRVLVAAKGEAIGLWDPCIQMGIHRTIIEVNLVFFCDQNGYPDHNFSCAIPCQVLESVDGLKPS